MARRTSKPPSRLELRKAAEAAESLEAAGGADDGEAAPKVKKKAAKKTVRRKSTKKKVDPTRLRMVWGVFDNSNQQVAVFPYTDRAAADKKAVEMTEKGRGPYFVQPVKEPLPLEPESAGE
jgi:hypothetical protein